MDQQVTELAFFRSLVADPEQIPLFEAAASVAQDEYPELVLQQVLADTDVLAERLAQRCRAVSTEAARLQTAVSFFYKELGFAGNINDYYSPDNSYLHKVLETRRGIPISLAVLLVELLHHVGIDAHGISFPGHFLVRADLHEGIIVIDPFTGGSLSNDNLQERLEPLRGHLGASDDTELPMASFLQPAKPHDILVRLLGNLREIYTRQREPGKLKRVLMRIELLNTHLS